MSLAGTLSVGGFALFYGVKVSIHQRSDVINRGLCNFFGSMLNAPIRKVYTDSNGPESDP
jgi:hypothetical protein